MDFAWKYERGRGEPGNESLRAPTTGAGANGHVAVPRVAFCLFVNGYKYYMATRYVASLIVNSRTRAGNSNGEVRIDKKNLGGGLKDKG